MSILKHLLFTAMMAAGTTAAAQQYYDITEQHLQNAAFDTDFKYDSTATGKQRVGIFVPTGWKEVADEASVSKLAVTMQFGTHRTVYDMETPRTDADGKTEGGFLIMSSTKNETMAIYQTKALPRGHYKLVAAYYNMNPDASEGQSRLGFAANDGTEYHSAMTAFEYGKWVNDTVSFELKEDARGQIQLGFSMPGNTVQKSAVIVVDYVKLLRDTPYGEADEQLADIDVVTDTRFARGATMAFGRIVSTEGDDIKEQGFCWAEHNAPTVNDNKTTTFLSNNGRIYWLKNLTPSTRYYMRAYVMDSNGKASYGKEIKFYTLPKGNLTYWYNNGGDDAANKRINEAAQNACDIFNDLTSIKKHFAIGYSEGTPTADCYYADEPWMNMGKNASYQSTGTIMHEMQHGLGVIPYETQWNKNILREKLDGSGRGTGHWLGDRVSAFLDFWDNTTGSQLNGDYQHLWPYGINGAQEDNHTNVLYFANAMIGQALGEDGLEHNYQTFAQPYYSFNHEDTIKYYLKNENEQRGRETAFLVSTSGGTLKWREMNSSEAAANDSAAWYFTFTPSNQYYQLRNAATGQYLTYSGGFKTVNRNTLTANDNFHLMRGRVDVTDQKLRGYWIIHPTGNWDPTCLTANANGNAVSTKFNIANSATVQRWLILTMEQARALETTSSIEEIKAGDTVKQNVRHGIYTLDGRKVAADEQQLKSLPKGIYIVGTKKIVVGK